MKTRVFAALAGLCLFGQALAASPTAQERYRAAAAEVQTHSDEFSDLDGSEAAVEALDRLWDAFQDWSAAYLQAHPQIGEKDLEAAAPTAGKSGEPPWVFELQPGLFAVVARFGSKADVFLLNRSGVVWDIRKTPPVRKGIEEWSTRHNRACYDRTTKKPGGYCGPSFDYALVEPVPPDRQGRLRFSIDADYAGNGGTRLHQFSIWRWDGRNATPLFLGTHAVIENDEPVVRQQGDVLLVQVKDEYKTLGAYGCCAGRQMVWRIRVSPDDVSDLGQSPVIPELDAVDALFAQLLLGRDASQLATPAVIAAVKPILAWRARYENVRKNQVREVAMIGTSAVRRRGNESKLCLSLDQDWDLDTPSKVSLLVFDLQSVGGGYFLKAVEIHPGNDQTSCEDFAAKAP